MLTENSSEIRSARPSLMMRLAKFVIGRRKSVFPQAADEVEPFLKGRRLPRDAEMPRGFGERFNVVHWQAAGHDVVTIHPQSGPGEWHMLYFHGGGFVLPIFKEHWPLAAAMVQHCGLSVTLPLYPVAPESSYREQDAVADAVFASLASTHDPARIVLGGDSAGGHMALSLALRLAETDGPVPGKLALFAPWLDVTMRDEAMRAVEPRDVMLKISALRAIGKVWAEDRDPQSPECSPLFAPPTALAKLPPTRIWTGRHDLFIVDSRSFAKRLRDAGVDARLYEYSGAPHVFMAITPTREAKDTFALLKDFLAQ